MPELHPLRVAVEIADREMYAAPFEAGVPLGLGPVQLTVQARGAGGGDLTWSVANRSDHPARVRAISIVFSVGSVAGPLRMFRNGYQSWSPTGVATFGTDVDPSTLADFEYLQAVHHADQRKAMDGELRSEWVTVLADGSGALALIGFRGGHEHDGTLRLRPSAEGPELWAEAFLGDAAIAPSEERTLHPIVVESPGRDDAGATELLAGWACETGRACGARTGAPFQVGWCSWYHYFHDISEKALRSNLALAGDWPFGVFQLDDGYQAAIGDWLDTNSRFPSDLSSVAGAIGAAGFRPGIWIAPFLVAPDSQVAKLHPDWLAGHGGSPAAPMSDTDRVLRAWWNPQWGGGENGFMYALDTTHPEVLDHLERVARDLVGAGFTYLKLDFTFAPSFDGEWHDPSLTPAQRVRAGYEAVRRGAGDDTFILGCGVPLSHVVGVVDANRIGQDVAPLWALAGREIVPGYGGVEPSTQHAYANTLGRAFMHRALWLNDPDCLMLRTTETDLNADAATTWARAVALSGGMALVSDDLALLGPAERALLDETVAIGRASDDAAQSGSPPEVPDLLDNRFPTTIRAAGHMLVTDTATGMSTFT